MEKYKKANELDKTLRVEEKLAKYHSEDLSQANYASRKPDLVNQSAASSQKTKRLKLLENQRILLVGG